jgi:hypothetical protein
VRGVEAGQPPHGGARLLVVQRAPLHAREGEVLQQKVEHIALLRTGASPVTHRRGRSVAPPPSSLCAASQKRVAETEGTREETTRLRVATEVIHTQANRNVRGFGWEIAGDAGGDCGSERAAGAPGCSRGGTRVE